MNKKKSPQLQDQDHLEDLIRSYSDIERHIFSKIGSDIYIGKDKVQPALRSLLRDESKNIQAMRLWEVLNASIINEAYDLALRQSQNFEQVQFAKALKHWSFFMMNVLNLLAKND
jgi:hypothetical protein